MLKKICHFYAVHLSQITLWSLVEFTPFEPLFTLIFEPNHFKTSTFNDLDIPLHN